MSLVADGLPTLRTTVPPEFDGPGGYWSPETLQVGAAVDCFVLTFRGLARVTSLPWTSLDCEATGTLDRVGRTLQFTDFLIQAHLTVPEGVSPAEAERVLARADETCLIASSLRGAMRLEIDVTQEVATPV